MSYIQRSADEDLKQALSRLGAVLIEGPKACGKTETALQQAQSVIHLDTDPRVADLMAIDPASLLEGATPRLLDEWQFHSHIWNFVRRAVDARKIPGQFILTGSTVPVANNVRHSGAGRFARLRMRTMTMAETGHSSADVSLTELLDGSSIRARDRGGDFRWLAERMARGGWPAFQEGETDAVLANVRDYVALIPDVDLEHLEGPRHDPERVRQLMRALARSTATEVSMSTLAQDAGSLSRDSVRQYLDALSRIFVIEDQAAWATHLRSSATLRREPKRHFCDPSLAVALLGADVDAIVADPAFAGQLFESLVIHDLRVYAQSLGGTITHARDSRGREVDAIVTLPGSRWAAFEVKLGAYGNILDDAARKLVSFSSDVDDNGQAPPILGIITGFGPSYTRGDGVHVIAIGALGP